MRRTALITSLLLAALAGCAKQPEATDAAETAAPASAEAVEGPTAAPGLQLGDARVQLPAVPGRPAVAYFTLNAGADAKGALVAVHADHFARAEMHQSRMEGGAMTMDPVDRVALMPGKPVIFAPGGYHVMLFDGDGTLKPGGTTELTLTLDSGDKISGTAKVTATGGDMAM